MNIVFVLILQLITPAWSDPCGMVPPISINPQHKDNSIARRGIQRTYVMHANGIETMALHPAFTGKIENFGMLIPFPSPPELYKIDDQTFAQLERAIDPPTLTVSYQKQEVFSGLGAGSGGLAGLLGTKGVGRGNIGLGGIISVREEALGMYQVAVIEAGSAKALKTWMNEHSYQFPSGMEEVTQEYVEEGWAFVAIKTKIGSKNNVEPKAGMRSVDTSFPQDASFEGYVQGMGFRFRTSEAVVPMRLSVFNGRDPHNIVYLFSDTKKKIKNVDQPNDQYYIAGTTLYENLTKPLDMEFQAGTYDELNATQQKQLESLRDPNLVLKAIRQLIQSDLMALRANALILRNEQQEKDFLAISESFELRGSQINTLHQEALEEQREKQTRNALEDLNSMHLSIFSGVLPNDLIQSENVHFSSVTNTQPSPLYSDPYRIASLETKAVGDGTFSSISLPNTSYTNMMLSQNNRSIPSNSLSMKNLSTTGSLKKNIAQKVLRRIQNQIRYCYQRQLVKTPAIQGEITFSLLISPNGQMKSSSITKDMLNSPPVSSCIIGRFYRIKFPKANEETKITFSYSFATR